VTCPHSEGATHWDLNPGVILSAEKGPHEKEDMNVLPDLFYLLQFLAVKFH
jgi:hypothetical protein